jgi:ATP-dependent DNA helicase PIF1
MTLTGLCSFPTRNEVENSNFLRMRELVGKAYKYEAKDSGTITDVNIREKLLANMMAPKVMELKKGAQVMLIKNMDDGLVNGSLGKVISFMSPEQFDIWYKDPDVFDENIATEDLDDDQRAARISIGKFSRTGSKSTLPDTSPIYPLVQFSVADGTSRDLLVMPEEWKVELPNGEIQAQREQLPLILAWALSIHKAQGQTLERVRIDLKKVFEKGQAYVALSRATSQNGLEVHGFEKSKVMAHPRVAEFYNSLYSVNKALEHPIVANAIPTKQVAENEKVAKTAKLERRTSYGFDNDEEEAMAAYG